MKKRIWNLIGSLILTAAIVFGVVQLNTSVVKADGCLPAISIGCGCMFLGGTRMTVGEVSWWTCTYLCGGCGGGGEPMYIEQTIEVYD